MSSAFSFIHENPLWNKHPSSDGAASRALITKPNWYWWLSIPLYDNIITRPLFVLISYFPRGFFPSKITNRVRVKNWHSVNKLRSLWSFPRDGMYRPGHLQKDVNWQRKNYPVNPLYNGHEAHLAANILQSEIPPSHAGPRRRRKGIYLDDACFFAIHKVTKSQICISTHGSFV